MDIEVLFAVCRRGGLRGTCGKPSIGRSQYLVLSWRAVVQSLLSSPRSPFWLQRAWKTRVESTDIG